MQRALVWLWNTVTAVGVVVWQAAVSLRHNWGIGLLAIVLALSLWVFVTDRENPQRTEQVPGTVPVEAVNVPPNQAVFPPLQESVTVRVRASQSVIERLTAEDFRATVDLSDVTALQATVNVRVESKEPRAEVVDVSPAQVTVRLENVTSQAVPVRARLVGTPPRGFEARETVIEPTVVAVTGPESLVARVQAVEADISLTDVRTDFQQTLLLQARDAGGGSIQGVKVEPESALVRVTIEQLDFSAVFVVQPDVRGVPADGYIATAIEVDPPFVVITGPAEVFQTLNPVKGIMTEAVPINDARDDVVREVALRLVPGARVEQTDVIVRVIIEPTVLGVVTPAEGG